MDNTPIPVGKFHTLRNGYRVHYHEAGVPTPGKPTVVFLHGAGPGASGYSNFKHNLQVFADAGWHCLAPDFLGFGLSDKPEKLNYSSPIQVAMLKELHGALGIETIVPVGNSLGGAISLDYYMTHPGDVEKLILMAPGGLRDPREWVGESVGLQTMWAWTSNRPTDMEEAKRSFHDLLALLVHDKADITADAVGERFPIAMEQPMILYQTLTCPYYLPEQLATIEVPVFGLWGKADKFLPYEQNEILKGALPNARISLSDECGHWFMIEQKERFNRECLEFLES
ncbi:alpha/beta fold hydrolase [Sphingosinicella soli]|uniref:4,5:9,10-diseco-3-hydroxy-5,9, 17-trioxoandrosta-1(10),2-diene-4-oate hydrolase n=1 Tax=Sphingosinicella soli TaxID=333708 RepID=A0A7W7B2J9_9SPHN|nr:4,5:9,10-diseco-3-hydroxy-5,9,17-trioxoandrosta-1(10),2-diene-4-oate hydrolase [Sphingosinicella soli]